MYIFTHIYKIGTQHSSIGTMMVHAEINEALRCIKESKSMTIPVLDNKSSGFTEGERQGSGGIAIYLT